jgi:ribonuclease J
VSGHASAEEMKLMLHLVKPKFFVPVHGELRHLHQHAALAREVGIPAENIAVVENGAVIEFQNDAMKLGERVPGGYVFVDGTGVGDIGPAVMREREMLAESGVVIVNLRVGGGGQLLGKPDILSKGFVFVKDEAEMFEAAQNQIAKVAANADGVLKERVEATLSDFFYSETKRRPMIFALINQQ